MPIENACQNVKIENCFRLYRAGRRSSRISTHRRRARLEPNRPGVRDRTRYPPPEAIAGGRRGPRRTILEQPERPIGLEVIYDAERAASIEVPSPGAPKGRERKQIRVGFSNGTRTEVVQGLTEGQKVILQ